MKIVQVEDFFHPDAGYQINIISKFFVKFGHEVTIITSELDKVPESLTSFFGRDNIEERDNEYSNKYGVKIIRLPVRSYISNRAYFYGKIFDVIKAEHPDVVFVHGNDRLLGMQYLLRLKKMDYPLIMDNHMLEMASNNKFNKLFWRWYKMFITPIIVKNGITVIRTQDDPFVNKRLGIPESLTPWLSVGSDTLLFYPDSNIRKSFREENGISEDSIVVLYAGKIDKEKGGKLLGELTSKKLSVNKDIVFVIVGKTNGEYGEEIEAMFKGSPYRVLRFPTQRYSDLAKFYQASDIAVFPKQCSLSFYDVQACGLPVVFEDNNINVDRAVNNNAFTFKSDSIGDFRNVLSEIINKDPEEFERIKQNSIDYVRQNYDYEPISREYIKEIENSVKHYKESKNGRK